MILGALLPEPEKPAWFLPVSGRLYFRKSQLPVGPDGIVEFRTKCELAVELLREQARIIKGRHLAVFDGGYALESVVRPLVLPAGGAPRIEFLTRLRCNARLYALPLPPEQYPEGKPGPKPKWGKRLEPPRRGGMWNAKWQVGTAFVYGRQREIRWKEIICLWRVLGWEVPVKAIVAYVEGYKERFTLVTSAVELTGLQMVELFTARFRQEDGFRDLKQRLGWEECRAWTANPIQRTSQAQWVTMSLLRLLQFRLEASGTGVIAPAPGIMRLFWAFSPSNPPESPSQEESSLANMPDTLEARCRSDGPPAGPRSIDPLPGSRSFLTVSAVA